MARIFIDHDSNIGKKFGKLLVLEAVKKDSYICYKCLCDCGTEKLTFSDSILKGRTVSCGCFYIESRSHKKNKPRKDIKPDGESAFNYLLWTYKRNAKKSNRCFELTREEFKYLTKQNCCYCGSEPIQKVRYYNKLKSPFYFYNGVDRVDNSRGYVMENCVPCCTTCNKAKATKTTEEFHNWIHNLIKFWKEKK